MNDALDESVSQAIPMHPRNMTVEQNDRRLSLGRRRKQRGPAQRRAVSGKGPRQILDAGRLVSSEAAANDSA